MAEKDVPPLESPDEKFVLGQETNPGDVKPKDIRKAMIDDLAKELEDEEKVEVQEKLRMIKLERELTSLQEKYNINPDTTVPNTRTKEHQETSQVNSTETKLLYNKPKLQKFFGKTDEDVYDWCEDAKIATKSINKNDEKIDDIIYHLGPNPRREIRYLSNNPSPEDIYRTLKRVFGIVESPHKSMTEFYTRKQNHNETISQYTQSLMKLMDIVKQSHEHLEGDKLLKEQLIVGAYEPKLRWELQRISDLNNNITFHQLREIAFKFELNENEQRKVSSSAVSSRDNDSSLQITLQKILDKQEKIEKEINHLKRNNNDNSENNSNNFNNNGYQRNYHNFRG
ncbi:unnamed protein product, partial [Owenia fusiformis]